MVKIEIEIPDVPREELDKLEDILGKLLLYKDRWEFGGREYIKEGKEELTANLGFLYEFNQLKRIEVKAEGKTFKGRFKTKIYLDLPDQVFTQLEHNLLDNAPYIGNILEKAAKSKKL